MLPVALIVVLGGSPAIGASGGEPSAVELVVDAPMMSDEEAPEAPSGEVSAPERQDQLNKAIIVAVAIAVGSLIASFGAMICCCCFYLGYYY